MATEAHRLLTISDHLRAKARILAAISKMSIGNFGGAKPIKGRPALFEYRIDAGSGYRIYYRVSPVGQVSEA